MSELKNIPSEEAEIPENFFGLLPKINPEEILENILARPEYMGWYLEEENPRRTFSELNAMPNEYIL
jgi:hypothetical protein